MRLSEWHASSSRRVRARHALARIAGSLECSVESLTRLGDSECYPDETAELVRLWFRIRDPGVRRAILESARRAAGGV